MVLDARCLNFTRFNTRCLPTEDRHGREVALVIAKIGFIVDASGTLRLDRAAPPIRLADVPASADPWASIRYPSDFVDEKPGTDVLLVGTAQPPLGTTLTEMDVTLTIADAARMVRKTVHVRGTSVWYESALGVRPGPPAPLRPTPLRYELAYGGRDENPEAEGAVDWRNPSGTGFAVDPARLVGQPAPLLEDPDAPLSSRHPAPAGFGPIAASWHPRRALAGTYDDAWRRARAPLRPRDFDPRHNCCAPAPLWLERPLVGGEAVEVIGATANGVWRFTVPGYAPSFCCGAKGQEQPLATHLDTLLVDADAQRIEISYRACARLPLKWQMLDPIRIDEREPLGELPAEPSPAPMEDE